MATAITVRLPLGTADGQKLRDLQVALSDAVALFGEVDRTCTRFDPASPLMRANAAPGEWHRVPRTCFDALVAAWTAYLDTGGRFDPRVLEDLVRLGYDRTLPFADGLALHSKESDDRHSPTTDTPRPPWRFQFHGRDLSVNLGGTPVDLGGIGKGLSVRWASERLAQVATSYLVDAGGDCYCAGLSADGWPWRIGVEDPLDRGPTPALLAVLELQDRACTTSSVRLRSWTLDGRPVHHLIDPRSREPGGEGVVAVTVVDVDPADAEVTSKTLFLSGAREIATEAKRAGVAALWVYADGRVEATERMEERTLWRRR